MQTRKTIFIRETITADGFWQECAPITRVAALAVVQNPFAGAHVEDLSELFDLSRQIGEALMAEATSSIAMPRDLKTVVSSARAALVPASTSPISAWISAPERMTSPDSVRAPA